MEIHSLNPVAALFKVESNFTNRKDKAIFFYSLNGKTWIPLRTPLKMAYIGEAADFDFFRITDSISTENKVIQY